MRLDKCTVCGHTREHHDAKGCLRTGCDCGGFEKTHATYRYLHPREHKPREKMTGVRDSNNDR